MSYIASSDEVNTQGMSCDNEGILQIIKYWGNKGFTVFG